MYDVTLTESFFPKQTDLELRDTTVPSVLRDAANRWPDFPALEETDEQGNLGRKWTSSE